MRKLDETSGSDFDSASHGMQTPVIITSLEATHDHDEEYQVTWTAQCAVLSPQRQDRQLNRLETIRIVLAVEDDAVSDKVAKQNCWQVLPEEASGDEFLVVAING